MYSMYLDTVRTVCNVCTVHAVCTVHTVCTVIAVCTGCTVCNVHTVCTGSVFTVYTGITVHFTLSCFCSCVHREH